MPFTLAGSELLIRIAYRVIGQFSHRRGETVGVDEHNYVPISAHSALLDGVT